MSKTATLSVDGIEYQLPIKQGTQGPDVIDVSSLAKEARFTFDPGFTSTASCESKITFIDGGKGILLYRGYPIYDLAMQCDFLEVCYLLLNGELPNRQQKLSLNITSPTIR